MGTLTSAVRSFLSSEVGPYLRYKGKKPLHLQLAEMYRIWRYWRYAPYQYVKYELYAKDFSGDILAFIPSMLIRKVQEAENRGPQLAIVRDKRSFEAHMNAHGVRCITPSWLVTADGVLRDARDEVVPHEVFREAATALAGDLFAKPVRGSFGRDVRVVRAEDLTPEALAGMVDTLLQPRVRQHPALSALFPRALNTIRLDSFLDGGDVRHSAGALRMGSGTMVFDNWGAGGLAVGIDLQTGKLFPLAYRKSRFGDHTAYESHPDTGVAFEGYQLPHWDAVKDLVIRAALSLPDLRTLCWDVAIAEDGPLLVEANDFWNVNVMQKSCGGLRDTTIGRYAARKHGLSHIGASGPITSEPLKT
jgi:hypothetical protein